MTTPDLNQLTIAGRVEQAPQLQPHEDCGTVCTFMLTHTVELTGNERFSAEIQFYSVAIYGPLGESFAAVYKPDQKVIIHGRLDCEHHETLTGYQPIASIIADRIITLHQLADDISHVEPITA